MNVVSSGLVLGLVTLLVSVSSGKSIKKSFVRIIQVLNIPETKYFRQTYDCRQSRTLTVFRFLISSISSHVPKRSLIA